MELANDPKNSKSPAGGKSTAEGKDDSSTVKNAPAKHNIEDMELNEEQLDIISGGGESGPLGSIKP